MSDELKTPPGPDHELIGAQVQWHGQTMSAGTEHYRFTDGQEVRWDKVWHGGAVAMLAVDDQHVWLVRQPRPAGGLSHALEIPAGKLDVEGEPPLAAAQRELAEEIGQQAGSWSLLKVFYVAPGWTDERLWLYLATDLRAIPGGASHLDEERLAIVRWPLTEIAAAIDDTEDAKTLIALQWLTIHLAQVTGSAEQQ